MTLRAWSLLPARLVSTFLLVVPLGIEAEGDEDHQRRVQKHEGQGGYQTGATSLHSNSRAVLCRSRPASSNALASRTTMETAAPNGQSRELVN